MPSLRAYLLGHVLDLLGPWRMFVDEATLRRGIAKLRKKALAQPDAAMRRRLAVVAAMLDGHEVIRIGPRAGRRGRVLYLHGGGYVEPAVMPHWRFIARMAEWLQLEFTAPRYPLAPEHDATRTMAWVLARYREFLSESTDPPIVMGDSAGGGLALALLQEARRQGLAMPAGLVLVSPWLDGTMSAPEQLPIEPHDVFLRRAGLLAAARWYAGALPLTHPWISPLNGSLDGLPPMLMLGSDRDILVTDMRRFAERAARAGATLDYLEQPGLFHDWPLVPVPFPERDRARERIARFVAQRLAAFGATIEAA